MTMRSRHSLITRKCCKQADALQGSFLKVTVPIHFYRACPIHLLAVEFTRNLYPCQITHIWVKLVKNILLEAFSVVGNSSIITVLKSNEWAGEYMCYVYGGHKRDLKDIIQIAVKGMLWIYYGCLSITLITISVFLLL